MACGGGCSGYPPPQVGDGTSCTWCGDSEWIDPDPDPPVLVPTSAAPIDEGIFTGYAPWEVDADAAFGDLFASAALGCVNVGYDRSANESCRFIDELQAWKDRNQELYCSFHRAKCDANDRGRTHLVLGGLGIIPVLGILFNGADAVLYIGEGDSIGAAIAIGASVPVAGAIGRIGRFAAASTRTLPVALPVALSVGRNAEKGVDVYLGMENSASIYVGISNSIIRRGREHGAVFEYLQTLTRNPVTRGEARAIEQALIVRNPGFMNKINSISPSHAWYGEAVDWGEQWLRGMGL
jgi:hypothetical protein